LDRPVWKYVSELGPVAVIAYFAKAMVIFLASP
jgi:hypothetical protein